MVVVVNGGPHFKDPTLLSAWTAVAANVSMIDTTGSAVNLSTTSAFTGFNALGIQDNTDWTANTYKTIYSHTGKGLVLGMVACTAGGAETTTFEITIDGIKSEMTVTNANTERAFLWVGGRGVQSDFTTVNNWVNSNSALDTSSKSTFQTATYNGLTLWRTAENFGVGMLQYDISCLVRMKHSTIITNSTATAYSAVLARKRITA